MVLLCQIKVQNLDLPCSSMGGDTQYCVRVRQVELGQGHGQQWHGLSSSLLLSWTSSEGTSMAWESSTCSSGASIVELTNASPPGDDGTAISLYCYCPQHTQWVLDGVTCYISFFLSFLGFLSFTCFSCLFFDGHIYFLMPFWKTLVCFRKPFRAAAQPQDKNWSLQSLQNPPFELYLLR